MGLGVQSCCCAGRLVFLPHTGEEGISMLTINALRSVTSVINWENLLFTRVMNMHTRCPHVLDVNNFVPAVAAAKHPETDHVVSLLRKRLVRYQDFMIAKFTEREAIRAAAADQTQSAANSKSLVMPSTPQHHLKSVLWLNRDGDRAIINEETAVQAMKAGGVGKVTRVYAKEVSMPKLIELIRSHDIIFGVHGADLANLAYQKPASMGHSVMIQLLHCGLEQGAMWSFKKGSLPNWLGGYSLVLGNTYIEAYADDFMDCAGLSDNHVNFGIKHTYRFSSLFKRAVEFVSNPPQANVQDFKHRVNFHKFTPEF